MLLVLVYKLQTFADIARGGGDGGRSGGGEIEGDDNDSRNSGGGAGRLRRCCTKQINVVIICLTHFLRRENKNYIKFSLN